MYGGDTVYHMNHSTDILSVWCYPLENTCTIFSLISKVSSCCSLKAVCTGITMTKRKKKYLKCSQMQNITLPQQSMSLNMEYGILQSQKNLQDMFFNFHAHKLLHIFLNYFIKYQIKAQYYFLLTKGHSRTERSQCPIMVAQRFVNSATNTSRMVQLISRRADVTASSCFFLFFFILSV